MTTQYDLFHDVLVDTLSKLAEASDEQRSGTKALVGLGTAAGVYAGTRSGKLAPKETLWSGIRRAKRGVRNAGRAVIGKAPEKMPEKVMAKSLSRTRSVGRAIPAGLAAAYIAGKGYDVYKGGKPAAPTSAQD